MVPSFGSSLPSGPNKAVDYPKPVYDSRHIGDSLDGPSFIECAQTSTKRSSSLNDFG